MQGKKVCGVILCVLLMATALYGQASRKATANLQPTRGNDVKGMVTFEEANGKVRVVANVSGLKPGQHGLHIHEKGDCSAPDASSAGGHFNPDNKGHGAPDETEHHRGDFGNIEADASGHAKLDKTVDFISVSPGPNSVVGKAVIVHLQEDDFRTQTSGNAGGRAACGVIQAQ